MNLWQKTVLRNHTESIQVTHHREVCDCYGLWVKILSSVSDVGDFLPLSSISTAPLVVSSVLRRRHPHHHRYL